MIKLNDEQTATRIAEKFSVREMIDILGIGQKDFICGPDETVPVVRHPEATAEVDGDSAHIIIQIEEGEDTCGLKPGFYASPLPPRTTTERMFLHRLKLQGPSQ